MSTRSLIAIKQNNSFHSVYCHNDGYLRHNGRILLEYYSDWTRVEELIKHGNMSSLGIFIHPVSELPHSFSKPQDDVCVFYHRDRKEHISSKHFWSEKSYLEECNNGIDYVYYYDPEKNKWFYSNDGNKFIELTEEDCYK